MRSAVTKKFAKSGLSILLVLLMCLSAPILSFANEIDNTTNVSEDAANIPDGMEDSILDTTNPVINAINAANGTIVTDDTTDVADDTTDVADGTTDVADDTTDVANDTTDVADDTTDVADDTTDVADDTTDVADDTTDVADDTTDVADDTTAPKTLLGSITVYYEDEEGYLLDYEIIRLPVGEYTIEAEDFSFYAYELVGPESITVTLTDEDPYQSVTFVYRVFETGFIVYHVDFDGHGKNVLLDWEVQYNIPLGEYTVTAKSFNGYQVIPGAKTSYTITLTEDYPLIGIEFYYEKIDDEKKMNLTFVDEDGDFFDRIKAPWGLTLEEYIDIAKEYEEEDLIYWGYALDYDALESLIMPSDDETPVLVFTIKYLYDFDSGTIFVDYVDEDGETIDYDYMEDLPFGEHTVKAKSFDGYELADGEASEQTVTLDEDNWFEYVVFQYQKSDDSEEVEVTIFIIDEEGNLLDELTAPLGLTLEEYLALLPNIPGYDLDLDALEDIELPTEDCPYLVIVYKAIEETDDNNNTNNNNTNNNNTNTNNTNTNNTNTNNTNTNNTNTNNTNTNTDNSKPKTGVQDDMLVLNLALAAACILAMTLLRKPKHAKR